MCATPQQARQAPGIALDRQRIAAAHLDTRHALIPRPRDTCSRLCHGCRRHRRRRRRRQAQLATEYPARGCRSPRQGREHEFNARQIPSPVHARTARGVSCCRAAYKRCFCFSAPPAHHERILAGHGCVARAPSVSRAPKVARRQCDQPAAAPAKRRTTGARGNTATVDDTVSGTQERLAAQRHAAPPRAPPPVVTAAATVSHCPRHACRATVLRPLLHVLEASAQGSRQAGAKYACRLCGQPRLSLALRARHRRCKANKPTQRLPEPRIL